MQRHQGRVSYVPGVSKPNSKMEHNGLKWICAEYKGAQAGLIVNPDTGVVKGMKFVRRSDDDVEVETSSFDFHDG